MKQAKEKSKSGKNAKVSKKRKSNQKDDATWVTSEIDEKELFSGVNVVDGFLGLEELHDYSNENLQEILGPPRKKKNKKIKSAVKVENVEDKIQSTKKENTENKEQEIEEETKNSSKSDPEKAKLSRKEKYKMKRKLLLKKKRRKIKEMKKQNKIEDRKVDEIVTSSCSNEIMTDHQTNVLLEDMSEWNGLGVPEVILKALSECKFYSPTPIQKESLPNAILFHQDIVGAAETGSGKTLAFAIPILTHIMTLKEKMSKNDNVDDEKPLYCLIVSPTRELALQIQAHINSVSKYTNVKSVAIVGGLATAKQERLLSKSPEIVIGTPGRLHTLITNGDVHLGKMNFLRYFVVDECDRMLEYGHFKELSDIIDIVNDNKKGKLQKFLFSATLTLPSYHKHSRDKKVKNESETQVLVNKVGLNIKAKVIDLTRKHVTASKLAQFKIMCTNEEKENYLLYFLLSHTGRTIIFVNSISCTRRLCSILTLMGREPLQLHAGKQQRQRLKYLDRFVKKENGLLVATDVAARGLDIPKVKNVVHFQLPIDPKVYIHRSGRTARANEDGISFIIEGPEDFKNYKKISQVLNLQSDIPTLNIERGYLDGIKERVKLARDIDKEESKFRKSNAESNWYKRAAKSMDLQLDNEQNDFQLTKSQKLKLKQKRSALQKLLKTNLIPKGFSGSYPTRTGELVVPGIQPLAQYKE